MSERTTESGRGAHEPRRGGVPRRGGLPRRARLRELLAIAGGALALLLASFGGVAVAHGDEEHGHASAGATATGSPTAPHGASASMGPGASARPAASCDPGASLTPGASQTPGASLTPRASLTPGASASPTASCDPGASASLPPGALEATGIVLSVDSPGLGRVDGFVLLTSEGEQLTFDTSGLPFDPAFPLSHVAEHQMTSDPVKVVYVVDGDRLVVISLADAD